MNSRTFRLLSEPYPRAWRERYADELADLCDEFIEAGEIARWRLASNIAVAASAERLRSWSRSGHRLVIGGGAAAVVVLAILAVATDGFRSFSTAFPSKGPVPINAVGNGHIDLSRVPDFVFVTNHGRVVGYTPKADVFPAPTEGVHLGLAGAPEIKPGYGPNFKTIVGHVYPDVGFVPAGVKPSTKSCVPTTLVSNDKGWSIPCGPIAVAIPNVVGMFTPTGVAKLSSLGLSIQIVNVKSELVVPGHIGCRSSFCELQALEGTYARCSFTPGMRRDQPRC